MKYAFMKSEMSLQVSHSKKYKESTGKSMGKPQKLSFVWFLEEMSLYV